MTKKYIAFTDNVLPVNGYQSTDEGKIAKVVDSSGSYKLQVVDAGQATCAWSNVTGKPFSSVGTGLTVTNDVLTADTQMRFQIFASLPAPSSSYAQVIALVLKGTSETGNLYDEFACVNTSGETWAWEKIGSTDFELTITQTAAGITINSTDLQSATSAQKGLLTAADWNTFNGKQSALTFDDAPTAGSSNPVKSSGILTALNAKQNTLTWDSTPTASSTNPVTSGGVYTALWNKVDKDSGTTVTFKIGCDSTGPYVEY